MPDMAAGAQSEPRLDPVSSLFSGSWRLYRERFLVSLEILLAPLVVIGLGYIMLNRTLVVTLFGVIFTFAGWVIFFMSSLALIFSYSQKTDLKESYQNSAKLFWSLLWIIILSYFVILGGFIMLIVPGIILGVWISFSSYVLAIENRRGINALLQSLNMSVDIGAFLGRSLLLSLLSVAFVLGFYLPTILVFGPIVGFIIYSIFILLFTPFSIAYVYNVYVNLRSLKPTLAENQSTSGKGFFIASGILGLATPIIISVFLVLFSISFIRNGSNTSAPLTAAATSTVISSTETPAQAVHPKLLSLMPDNGTLLDRITITGEGFDLSPKTNQVHFQTTDGTFTTVTVDGVSTDGRTMTVAPCNGVTSEDCDKLQSVVNQRLRVFVTRASDGYTSEAINFALINGSDDVVAQDLKVINVLKNFSIIDFPDAKFIIKKIYKATGGVSISPKAPCGFSSGSATRFIFLKYLTPGASPPGLCFDGDNSTVGDQKASLVVVDLEVANNGSDGAYGEFLQLFYSKEANGQQATRLAQPNPNWSGYGAAPFSSRRILLGFEIPSGQDKVQLVYGNYGSAATTSGEDFFGKSEGGFIVDFKTGTITDIPG